MYHINMLYTPNLELRMTTSHAARFRRDYLIIDGYQFHVPHITFRSVYFRDVAKASRLATYS